MAAGASRTTEESEPGDSPIFIATVAVPPFSCVFGGRVPARVVTFDRIIRRGGGQRVRRRCVGVELNAADVTGRMGRLPRPPEAPPPTAEERELNEAVLMPWAFPSWRRWPPSPDAPPAPWSSP